MGWRQVAVISPLVIIESTGTSGTGLFVYNGIGSASNPPIFAVVAPGVTKDPFGNNVLALLNAGALGGAHFGLDSAGNAYFADATGATRLYESPSNNEIAFYGPGGSPLLLALSGQGGTDPFTSTPFVAGLQATGADGSALSLLPQGNLPFSLTNALTGIMQTLMTLVTQDVNETQAGVVSGIVLGSGATAKMGTLIMSPYVTNGMGMILQAENDGGTDTPLCTWGTVATQGGVLTFTPVMALGPQVLILYSGGGTVTVVTKTSGSGTIPIPVGVTVGVGETWGDSTNGGSSNTGGGGGGAGSGGYSKEPALALTSGGTAAFSVGAAASGADTTLTGSAVTVTAHPGAVGGSATTTNPGTAGAGAPASTNTVAVAGAAGAAGSSGGAGGKGGNCPNGGGSGGSGGPAGGGSGGNGAAPGGGGGGGGGTSVLQHTGGLGAAGRARLTYTSGAPAILASVAAAAGTDQYGTAYGAGLFVSGQSQNISPRGQSMAATGTGTAISGISVPVVAGTYWFHVHMIAQWNAAAGQPQALFTGPAVSTVDFDTRSWQTGTTTQTNAVYAWNNGSGNIVGYNTSGQPITGAMTVAGVPFIVDCYLRATFTAAGTVGFNGATSIAADAWLVEQGFIEWERIS